MYKNQEQLRQEKLERNYQRTIKYNSRFAVDLCISVPQENPCYIYIIQCGDFPYYKIGITNNLEERINGLQLGNPFRLHIIDHRRVESKRDALVIEDLLHTSQIGINSEMGREWHELSEKELLLMREILADT